MAANLVYKYSGWDNFSKDALLNRYFWFSKPTNFNDPFDCNMEVLLSHPEIKSYLDKQKGCYKMIKSNTDNFGVLCFTKPTSKGKNGDRGYNNKYFWSHYANDHKGFVLGFDESKINDYYSSKILCKAELKPVNYKNYLFEIKSSRIIIKEESHDSTMAIIEICNPQKNGDAFFEQLLLTKDKRIWGVENECRIILAGQALTNLKENDPFGCFPFHIINDSGYKIPYPEGDVLKEVTFGVKFNKKYIKNTIAKIAKYHKSVNYYQAGLDFKNADVRRGKIQVN